jgi:hypothetical protein
LIALVALSACGGGGGGGGANVAAAPNGGISGSGQSVGSIDNFGSVIVNGTEFETNAATIRIDGIPGIEADLSIGQVVQVVGNFDNGEAESIDYRSDIKGPIESITIIDLDLGQATIETLGQTVRVVATTLFSNISLELLAAGNLIEISGLRNANGTLVASFVERKAALAEYKLVGTAANVTATTFTVDNLTVDYATATLHNFPGGAISSGDFVEIKADPADFTAPADLSASIVERIAGLAGDTDEEFEVEGFISGFDNASKFDVAGLPVRTSAATTFINGSSGNLANNAKVEVEGVIASDGVLQADSIEFLTDGSVRIEGVLEAVDLGAMTVRVLGVTVEVRPETELEDKSAANEDPLTLADLTVSVDRIELRGFIDGVAVVATELDREDPAIDARLRGPATDEDAAAGTVDILGITATGQAGFTNYFDTNDGGIDQNKFHTLLELGDFVDAQWDTFTSTAATANELSLEDDD